jgi:hypothetical protein
VKRRQEASKLGEQLGVSLGDPRGWVKQIKPSFNWLLKKHFDKTTESLAMVINKAKEAK